MHSVLFFFFKQKTAYEMRISDWSSDVCSSDLWFCVQRRGGGAEQQFEIIAVMAELRGDDLGVAIDLRDDIGAFGDRQAHVGQAVDVDRQAWRIQRGNLVQLAGDAGAPAGENQNGRANV